MKKRITFALCFLLPALCSAAEAPPRLFFSDAKLSFIFPRNWNLQPAFPLGPLFTKKTRDGGEARISCAISNPLDPNRISADIPMDMLKNLARQELTAHQTGFKPIAERERSLAGHNAFEISWEHPDDKEGLMRHESIYFFVENRLYALNLQARAQSFPWLEPDFQGWLATLNILSSKEAGALEAPAHGGLWIHQTAGAKIPIPPDWLIGVADDHTLGATLVNGSAHCEFTATADPAIVREPKITSRDKKEFRKSLRKKGFKILEESDEPFHGFLAFRLAYEGSRDGRTVKGMDLWVMSPKGRWLLSLEGDTALYNSMAASYRDLLNNIEFL